MGARGYDGWAMRVDQAIKAGAGRAGQEPMLREAVPPRELLLRFAREASLIAGAVGRHVDAVCIQGSDRYDALAGFIDNMLQLDDFSLLELRYKIPAQREPGLRFRAVASGDARRIEVQFFEDLVAWPVDEQGRWSGVGHRAILV